MVNAWIIVLDVFESAENMHSSFVFFLDIFFVIMG